MPKNKNGRATDGYDVGRGKPPKHSRFQKGQSGNPGGRRKNVPNLRTVINAVMMGQIEVSENGRPRKVSVVEAILLRQVQEALRGQVRAAESLLDRFERCAATETAAPELPEEDLALLDQALGRSRSGAGSAAMARAAACSEQDREPEEGRGLDPDDACQGWGDE